MRKIFFSAEVRKVIVSGIVCMLLLAVVSCENVKLAYDEEYVEECKKECAEEYVEECVKECDEENKECVKECDEENKECVKECDEENKECVKECDFNIPELDSELCRLSMGWAVEFRLKSGTTDCPTENSKIKALVAEHTVTFRPSFPGTSNTVLMRYYTLIGENCDDGRSIIRVFLETGLFENHVRVFGLAYITN